MVRKDHQLNQCIEECRKCPRLVEYRQQIARTKRKSFLNDTYWGKAVENFGDSPAQLLIVGLAPAAHGANRTGRMFTGDQSGVWLYRALHKAGFATKASSVSRDDDLKLINTLITAICHCAPPDNKPLPDEISNCSEWLHETFRLVQPKCIIALGQIAWTQTWKMLRDLNIASSPKIPKFSHGIIETLREDLCVIGSYHPSQQNTFTGKLTEPMFDHIFELANQRLK